MTEQIIQLAIGNGLWAVLFVLLFFYQLKDSAKREKKYITLIDELSLDVAVIKKVELELNVVHSDVLSIRKLLLKRGGKKSEALS